MNSSALLAAVVVCLTAILLVACVLRRGGVRGVLRAWRVFEIGIEIDAERAPRPRRRRRDDDHARS